MYAGYKGTQQAADKEYDLWIAGLKTLAAHQNVLIKMSGVLHPFYTDATVRAAQGQLSAFSVSHSKSVLYGGFVWARRALKH